MGQARDMRDQLVALLRGVPGKFAFNDTNGHARFDKKTFNKLANALTAWFFDKVEVELFSPDWFRGKFGAAAGAYYSPEKNVFGFQAGFAFDSPYRKSVAIHESIHALQDGLGLGYTPPDHEVVAYAGQAFYYRLINTSAKSGIGSIVDKNTPEGKIFHTADRVADLLLDGKSLTVGDPAVVALRKAIRSHPNYKTQGKKKKKKIRGSGW